MTYKQYLKTHHWQAIRKQAIEYAEYKCQLCNNSKNLDVHHNTYENLWNEKLRDLIVLCKKCHNLFHDDFIEIPENIPEEKIFIHYDMWPVILMDDGTYCKGPRAEIIGKVN